MLTLRYVTAASALLIPVVVSSGLAAQPKWPEREVRLIVPLPAGGSGGDAIARLMAEKLNETWGQPVVVENIPGSAGSIGIGRLAQSQPDGYTLALSGDAAIVVNVSLYKSLTYDPVKSLAPIIRVGRTPNILVVNAEKGPGSLKDLVAQAKAKPGSITFNSNGYGTSQHIGFELLKKAAAIDINHTPSRTSPLPDVLGGHITASFMNIAVAMPNVSAGKLKALGVSGTERSAAAPDVPTVAEQGYPGFNAVAWFGLFAPAGTPGEIISKVNADAAKALTDPAFRKRLTDLGVQIDGKDTPESFATFIKAEIPRVAELLKDTGIKLD
jgi:tripartite-type tricarboxylate transporter receptor subunit TctC